MLGVFLYQLSQMFFLLQIMWCCFALVRVCAVICLGTLQQEQKIRVCGGIYVVF